MNFIAIAWSYLWDRAAVTVLTAIAVALGALLITSVLTIRTETEKTFENESALFDLVVGAKGSPLQLVLSSVYHLDVPTGNIPYKRFEALKKDFRVKKAIPIGLGDNYKGFRIVGTSNEMFSLQRTNAREQKHTNVFSLQRGRFFETDFEVVLGCVVAEQTGLKLGDEFVGTHGLVVIPGSEEHKKFPYKVVGILEPTATSNDRAIFCTLDSVWIVHDDEQVVHKAFLPKHLRDGTQPSAESKELEVTSVLLQLDKPGMRLFLSEEIKNETESMAAVPVNEMFRLYRQILGPIQTAFLSVAYLVVVVAALTVAIGLYQAAERRRKDIAVMRALGAYPREIFVLVLLEALLLSILGVVAGWFLGHLVISAASWYLLSNMGLTISGWSVSWEEFNALALVVGIGWIGGLLPAFLAYRRSPVADINP